MFGLGCHLWGFTKGKTSSVGHRQDITHIETYGVKACAFTQTQTDCLGNPSSTYDAQTHQTHILRVYEYISLTYLMFIPLGTQSETTGRKEVGT